MSDSDIINCIKHEPDLYKIFQIIADIGSVDFKNFSTKTKTLNTIIRIFASRGITQRYTDDRIRNISHNGFDMIGFSVSDRENTCLLYSIIHYIDKLNERVMEKYGVCIIAAAFAWDSSSNIVFAVEDIDRTEDNMDQSYEITDKVRSYLEDLIGPVWKVYTLNTC